MTTRSGFLVVEDDWAVARTWWRLLKDFRITHVCHSAQEAYAALESERIWCGFLIDVDLGGANGLDVLAHARTRHPLVPALVLTAHAESEFINRAFALRASYLCKPVGSQDLLPFVYQALTQDSVTNERVSQLIDALARQRGLSPREIELLTSAMSRSDRKTFLRDKGVSVNTVKSQIRSLLRKTGAKDLDDLVIQILLAAVNNTPFGEGTTIPSPPGARTSSSDKDK